MNDRYPNRWSHNYCLSNLGILDKLESFACTFLKEEKWNHRIELLQNLKFPPSLQKLALEEWNPVEGEFLRLKFLLISHCDDLIYWTADNTHFPCLEHLVLEGLDELKEIPLDIGEIQTLGSIKLRGCPDSAVISAKNISDEQMILGNMGLQIRVELARETNLMDSVETLESDNFQIINNWCNIM